jgi:hypothetical protein
MKKYEENRYATQTVELDQVFPERNHPWSLSNGSAAGLALDLVVRGGLARLVSDRF